MDTIYFKICEATFKYPRFIMSIILFGANNPAGAAFISLPQTVPIESRGRSPGINSIFCDLSVLPLNNKVKPLKGVLVSFAPIWLLAPFLEYIADQQPEALVDLVGVVACSSSSFITKRFAFNRYDQNLVDTLAKAHDSLTGVCNRLRIPLQILAPTLIYGSVHVYTDKNISKILQVMRLLPLIVLPKQSGSRQPIHAFQLSLVAQHQAQKILSGEWSTSEPVVLAIGGDEILSYEHMILKAKSMLDAEDSARNCKIVTINAKLFILLATPLILFDLKQYESVLRICSNLSGFAKSHEITRSESHRFPITLS